MLVFKGEKVKENLRENSSKVEGTEMVLPRAVSVVTEGVTVYIITRVK